MKPIILIPNSGTQMAGRWITTKEWATGVSPEQIIHVGKTKVFLRDEDGDEEAYLVEDQWFEVDPPVLVVEYDRFTFQRLIVDAMYPDDREFNGVECQLEWRGQKIPCPTHIEIDGKPHPLVFLVPKGKI